MSAACPPQTRATRAAQLLARVREPAELVERRRLEQRRAKGAARGERRVGQLVELREQLGERHRAIGLIIAMLWIRGRPDHGGILFSLIGELAERIHETLLQ